MEVGYHLRGSIGKALFGLRVQVSGRARHYLRETLGKLASMATFGIGFLLVFSKERLALHDYIAKTRIVVQRPQRIAAQALCVVALLLGVGFVAYWGARLGVRNEVQPPSQPASNSLDAITRQISAVLTLHLYNDRGQLIGQGSGFILSGDGLAASNFHVLSKAYRAEAELGDGRLFHVLRITAFDPNQDLVLFRLGRRIGEQIDWPHDLAALTLGSSIDVRIGDRVAAITSPEGLPSTVTDGVVSAVRSVGQSRFLQITAPISPGSSGGPVFDMDGRVIGIASFQLREGQNLNFAIPVERLVELQSRSADLTFEQFRTWVQAPPQRTVDEKYVRAFRRGLEIYNAGQYLDAVKVFLKAQQLRPEEAAAYYNAALCYDQAGLSDLAAVEYLMFLVYAPDTDPDRKTASDWLVSHGYKEP